MFIKIFVLSLFIVLVMFPVSYSNSDKGKGKLVITFNGLNSNKGAVKVALTNSYNNYKDHKNPFIGLTIPISNKEAIAEFVDLPFGEYAVKAFHDEDGNDMLNTNILGIPTENYGFSNDVRGMFGPPSWDNAKFLFNQDKKSINIIIK